MKRRFSAELIAIFLVLMVFVSCRTAESNANEILKSSIDLASAYAKAGEYDKAIDVYDRAWSQLEDYRILYNKAMTIAASGKYPQAINTCQEGIDRFPSIMAFRTALVSFLETEGRVNDCIRALERLVAIDPYNSVMRIKLMNMLYEKGDIQRAKYHASVLWDQGKTDNKDVAKVLEYQALYEILTRGEEVPEPLQEESIQSDELSSTPEQEPQIPQT